MITRDTIWTSQSGRRATLGAMPTGHVINARNYLQRRIPYKIVNDHVPETHTVTFPNGRIEVHTQWVPVRRVIEKTINDYTYAQWIEAFGLELQRRNKGSVQEALANQNVEEFNVYHTGTFPPAPSILDEGQAAAQYQRWLAEKIEKQVFDDTKILRMKFWLGTRLV